MNSWDTQLILERLSRVVRCARKDCNLSQIELADSIETTQGYISKLESGVVEPSISIWHRLCKTFDIDPDFAFQYGLISHANKTTLKQETRIGKFKIKPEFAKNAGSKVRNICPFLKFGIKHIKQNEVERFLKKNSLDLDYFVNLEHQLNFNFFTQLHAMLSSKIQLNNQHLEEIASYFLDPYLQGSLYQDSSDNSITEVLTRFVNNKDLYEVDFKFQFQKKKNNLIELMIKPNQHLKEFNFYNNTELKKFMARFHLILLRKLIQESSQKAIVALDQPFDKNKSYVYKIRLPKKSA